MLELNTIHNMDCLEGLKLLEANTIDSIVTDPPYELGFMGKKWDNTGISYNVELWKECLRVLKPGGHLLSFGGSRTYHRMACAIEDSGFEIRDQIMWIYGSGFPKSMNISKAIDKKGKDNQQYKELSQNLCSYIKEKRLALGLSTNDIARYFPSKSGGLTGCYRNWEYGNNLPTLSQWEKIKTILLLDNEEYNILIERKINKQIESKREVIGKNSYTNSKQHISSLKDGYDGDRVYLDITTPKLEEAKQWDGWGTALKPAHEPIVVARKPLSENTIVNNILKWNTGGFNIDDCKAKTDDQKSRFPSNIILDEEAGKSLDIQSIGASRFFYCAKSSKKERGKGNIHPTVKPMALIKYLITLVTPPNGISLDPFEGSGTHALSCKELGFNYIGFEMDNTYCEIGRKRLEDNS